MLKFAHDIAGGQGNLVISSLQSPNFVDQVSGWQVTKDGDAQFNNVETRGSFYGFEFIINDSGAFFYTGTPAAGNLQASITSTSGSDQFGNPYGTGFNLYGPGGTLQLINNSSAPAVMWTPASVAHMTSQPQAWAWTENVGLASELMFMLLTSGKSGGNDAAIQLFGESADGTVPAKIIFEFGGAIALTLTEAGLLSADTWHALSLVNSWATSSDGLAHYKLMPDNSVWIMAVVVGGNATTIATLPAGYRPPSKTVYAPCDGSGSLTTGLYAQVTTAGVLSLNTISNVGDVVVNFRYPIDGP